MNIVLLRKRTLSPVRLVLEDSLMRSFMLFVNASLQLGSIIQSKLNFTNENLRFGLRCFAFLLYLLVF